MSNSDQKFDPTNLQNMLALAGFGTTLDEAHKREVCINCKKDMSQPEAFPTRLDREGYKLSGLCVDCFDEITKETE